MTNAQTRTRRDPDLWNNMVNAKFDGKQPKLTPEESIAAAKKLYRHAMGFSYGGTWRIGTGNRHTWARRGVFTVNPDERRNSGGLREIIHSISHYCHQRLHPNDKPHSIRQVRLEAKLAKFAVDRNCWLDGALKKAEPETVDTKPSLIQQRHQRLINRRDKWLKEAERAKRLLAKAESEVRQYERRHKERLNA